MLEADTHVTDAHDDSPTQARGEESVGPKFRPRIVTKTPSPDILSGWKLGLIAVTTGGGNEY